MKSRIEGSESAGTKRRTQCSLPADAEGQIMHPEVGSVFARLSAALILLGLIVLAPMPVSPKTSALPGPCCRPEEVVHEAYVPVATRNPAASLV
jgi:hypothetical protein